ncbi:universal stress protein [Methanospirillum stamsii]|uniref:UspA domain-containing protein n=1 Tax=Methanospirillum stamsii TaxID=1277351 RepID=A0A2V2N4R6_9EURY|nr:universal stress protein [Methanospirillum stamsii]PWR71177.1 hypothetical protein DLD82_13980 [Methanospirillum stamsii]
MFKKIIIPIDFSEDSKYIIKCLSKIPQIREVILLNITKSLYLTKQTDTINPDVDYARLRLEELRKVIAMPRSKIKVLVEEITGGTTSEIIEKVAVKEEAGLVIMGRRGRGVIETLLIGSTAIDLLKYGTKNLLLIHPPESEKDGRGFNTPCPDLLSRILICTDFSKPYIEELCISDLIHKNSVTLFHVITTGDSKEEVQENCNVAKEKLEKMKEKLSPHAKDIHIDVAIGDAAQEILAYAKKEDVSMIVLKSTGEKSFIKNLLGTTTDYVARTTQIPVLILRNREVNTCSV